MKTVGAPFRSATLLLVAVMTFHGRIFAFEADGHAFRHPLSGVTVTFYEATSSRPESMSFGRGRLVQRLVTDSAGRFTARGLRKGYYLITMSSSDVPLAEELGFFDPGQSPPPSAIAVCSKRFNHSCDPPIRE